MSFDYYRNRVLMKGNTSQERILHEKKRSFDEYLREAPTVHEISIGDSKYLVSIQDVKFHDMYQEDKYMLTHIDLPINVGSYVGWDNDIWLVRTKENESLKDHQTYRMAKTNHNLKFIDSTNSLITKPCIVSAKTLYTTGVRDEKVIEIPNGMVGIQFPYDEDTKKLKRDDSFIFNDTKYRITFLNKVEFQGLLILICDEEAVDELTDDLENEIANRYIDGKDRLDNTQPDIENPDIPTNPPTEDNFTISITGQDTIQLMSEQTYNAKIYNNGIKVTDKLVTWTKTTDLANIKSQNGNTITLSANTKWNTGEFKLRATLVDDETIFAEKTLYVTS